MRARVAALLDGETDWIAALATVVAELHNAFEHFDFTGFYRVTAPELLVIGPYQGYGSVLRMGMAPGIAHRFACDLQNVLGLVRREKVICGGVHL